MLRARRSGICRSSLLIGETSSTKTSTMVHSGLEPELLAGQIYQDGNITSTRCANLVVFAANDLCGSRRQAAGRRPGPRIPGQASAAPPIGSGGGPGGQAPRAALVCVEIERITAGGQAMAATARNLRARLGEIAQAFGIQLPVYVLFTKADRLSFFADFVRNLSNEEAAQPLGVTLPIPGRGFRESGPKSRPPAWAAFSTRFSAPCATPARNCWRGKTMPRSCPALMSSRANSGNCADRWCSFWWISAGPAS